jgi:hypothetical protein
MSERIYEALDRHFSKHRIVFWYDPLARMRDVYEGYIRESIERVELANNEFQVKHRLIRDGLSRKFLVYSPKERPPEAEDWLLDLALEHFVFSTDEAAMYLQNLGLSDSLRRLVAERIGFFRDSKDNLAALSTTSSSPCAPMTRQRHVGLVSSNGNSTRYSSRRLAAISESRSNRRNPEAYYLGSSRMPLHSRPAIVRQLTRNGLSSLSMDGGMPSPRPSASKPALEPSSPRRRPRMP